jgi:DNA-directed RNA polymerase specialized sigma24 family protein
MHVPESHVPCTQQLEELQGDQEFQKVFELVTKEVMRSWSISSRVARSFVLSAIGEPETLASIHRAWFTARKNGDSLGLAKVIVRRRVIDLLRKDRRQADHCSMPTAEALESDSSFGSFNDLLQRNPHVQVELRQVIEMVRGALSCFATQGRVQRKQAQLLQRYALDEATYAELGPELSCSESALRVRVHKAMLALRKHIRECHTDLEDVLDRDRPR